jgi:UDP-2,3-diacylglucosamine pyrophosphatase LpxH
MKKQVSFLLLLLFCSGVLLAQEAVANNPELYFVSDTQQPMFVEKLVLKPNHNKAATADIFAAIQKDKPESLYMLGDVVGLGSSRRKWKKVDIFLDHCRKEGTNVCGLLGNHEVMGRSKRGERFFQQRFPMNVSTGYVSVTDSVAVIMLNSNFSALSAADENKQQQWYSNTLAVLDTTAAVKAIIVCCHHAPFTNSNIVKCNTTVQQQFVPGYIASRKAQLFITGHAHAFEHFSVQGKDFLVIGGGGGLHQPLSSGEGTLNDLAIDYKPMFHYLSVKRMDNNLVVRSHFLKTDFSGFDKGISFNTRATGDNLAAMPNLNADKKGN